MPSVETISLILNIITYVLLGLVLIKSFIGLGKGIWKTTCSFVVAIILYILVIFLNPTFTQIYYEIDFSFLNQSFVVNSQLIEVTTIGETLKQTLFCLSSEVANQKLALSTCEALARSILSFVVFLIHMIIVAFIISPIFSLIIYHLLFKHIIGKNLTKNHKIRWGGFLINGVKAVVTSCLLLSPFTSLVNQISTSSGDNVYSGDNEILNDYISAYNNSMLAKIFTSVKIDDKSFDIALTQFVTRNKIEGEDDTYVSFMEEFGMLTDIACEGLQEGIITLGNITNDYSQFLSKAFVTLVLQKFASSSLVTTLLPVALSVIVNADNIKQVVDLTSVDWYKIEWEDELNTLSSVYNTFYDSGLVDCLFDEEQLKQYQINEENYQIIKNTCLKLNDSEVLTDVMPYLLSSYAKSLDGTELEGLLSKNVDEYSNLDIGNELASVCDTVKTISELANYAYNTPSEIITEKEKYYTNQNNRYYLTIGDLMDQDRLNKLTNFLMSEEAIKGQNEEVTFKSWDDRDIKTENIFNGFEKIDEKNEYNGILDSTLLIKGLPTLIEYGLNSSEDVKKLNITDIIVEEISSYDSADLKNEVSSLLNIVSIIMNNPNLPLDDKFDIFNQSQVDELKKITEWIDKSKLIKKIIKPMLTNLVGEQDIMGLKITDFDFEIDNLGEELKNLLDLTPKIKSIQDSLADGLNGFIENKKLSENINEVLIGVYDCKIVNPNPDNEGLNNFEKLLQTLFSSDELISNGFKQLDDSTLLNIRKKGWKNEITSITDALGSISELESVSKLIQDVNDGKEISIQNIDGNEVKVLINNFTSSQIVSHSLGNILNKYLKEQMQSMGISVDFENVSDWSNEADNLSKALISLKSLDNNGFSLNTSNINIYNLTKYDNSVNDLKSLLKSIYNLQCIREKIADGTYENKFGDLVYNLTENVFSSYVKENDVASIKEDHNFKEQTILFNENSYVSWNNENYIEGNSVIDDICALIEYIVTTKDTNNDLAFFENKELSLEKSINEKEVLQGLLERINNIYIYRSLFSKMVPTLIEDNVEKLNINGLDFKYLNSNVFEKQMTYSFDQKNKYRADEISIRQKEIANIADVYTSFNNFIDQIKDNNGNIDFSIESISQDGTTDDLNRLLVSMAKSKLFNDIKENDSSTLEDHTFFQELMKYILVESTLSEKMSSEQTPEEYALQAVKSISNTETNNEWLKLEIDNFIDAIKNASKISSLFNDASGNMLENLEPTNVSDMIKSFAKSKYLNYKNGLGKLLNSQLSSSFDGTGLIIDFTKVGKKEDTRISEWNEEANNLGQLLMDLKSLNGNKITFDIEIKSLNVDTLKNVLTDLHALKVVQNNNEESINNNGIDNFGSFIYTNITEKAFNEYIKGDVIKTKVKQEHSLDTETFNVGWNSEIEKLCNLISSLQNNFIDENNQINLGKIEEKPNEIKTTLNALNEIYAYRSLIEPLLKSKIGDLKNSINSLDLNKAYISIFSNELDYKKSGFDREQEITKRKTELNVLVDVFTNSESLADINGNGLNEFSNKMNNIKETLNSIYASKILTKNEIEYISSTTIFEDAVKFIMDKTTLSKMILDKNSSLSQDDNVINKIKYISNEKENLHWDNKEDSKGEIEKLCSFLEIATSNNINDKSGNPIAFDNIDQINDLSSDSIKTLLNGLNVSYLCHDAVANAVNNVYETAGILDYAIIKDNPIDAHYIEKNNTQFIDQVEKWSNDIVHLVNIYILTNGGKLDSLINESNDKVNKGIFTKILPNVGKLENLGQNKADIIYGIFKKANINEYILKTNSSIDLSISIVEVNLNFTLDDYYRRVTLDKLINKIDFSWDNEATKLDNLVNEIKNLKGQDLKSFDLKKQNNEENIIELTYSNNQRGYLASELLSSFLENKINSLESTISYNWRKYNKELNYLSFNEFESNGLIYTIEFASLLNEYINNVYTWSLTDFNNWKLSFENATYYMGNNEYINNENYKILNKTIANLNNNISEVKINGNTEIAEKLFEAITKDEITKIDTLMLSLGTKMDWSLNNKTFESKCKDDWISNFEKVYNSIHAI